MADPYGGEVIHRVRAELVPHRRELKLYVLCRCGSGAWLVSIVPFEELFFDEHLVWHRQVSGFRVALGRPSG